MRKRAKRLFALVLSSTFLLSSCSKDDNPNTPDETGAIKYAVLTQAGSYPNNTAYLQGLENLDATHIDNSRSTEFASGALLHNHNGAAIVAFVAQPATMTRFAFDDAGKMVEGTSLRDPAGRNFTSLCFVGDNDAYAATVGSGNEYKVIRFDPVTMNKTGDVDISALHRPGIPTMYIQGIVKRGDKLFMGVYYEKDFTPIDEAVVAIVDIATQKVEKVISDTRTSRIFIGNNGGAFSVMQNGDIYVMGYGTANKPSGIVRIKNNESDFDPSYFMNLDETTGGICRNFFPYSETKAITARIEDPSDEWEINGPNFSYYIIDIVNRTVQGKIEGLPVVFGANPPFLKQINGEWLLNAAAQGTSAVYKFDPSTETVSKKFTVDGRLTNLVELK